MSMSKSKLPHSLRKYLRKEKSRIRGTVTDRARAEQEIRALVEKTMALRPKRKYTKKS